MAAKKLFPNENDLLHFNIYLLFISQEYDQYNIQTEIKNFTLIHFTKKYDIKQILTV